MTAGPRQMKETYMGPHPRSRMSPGPIDDSRMEEGDSPLKSMGSVLPIGTSHLMRIARGTDMLFPFFSFSSNKNFSEAQGLHPCCTFR